MNVDALGGGTAEAVAQIVTLSGRVLPMSSYERLRTSEGRLDDEIINAVGEYCYKNCRTYGFLNSFTSQFMLAENLKGLLLKQSYGGYR